MSATYSIEAAVPTLLRKCGKVSPKYRGLEQGGGSLTTNRRAMARNDSSPTRRRVTGKRATRMSVGLAAKSVSARGRARKRVEIGANAPGSNCLKRCWILAGVATARLLHGVDQR